MHISYKKKYICIQLGSVWIGFKNQFEIRFNPTVFTIRHPNISKIFFDFFAVFDFLNRLQVLIWIGFEHPLCIAYGTENFRTILNLDINANSS
jgi:hypothetical protein